jgi:O-acetyl-ADP-ribose deacetylase (regulator of RNase III)
MPRSVRSRALSAAPRRHPQLPPIACPGPPRYRRRPVRTCRRSGGALAHAAYDAAQRDCRAAVGDCPRTLSPVGARLSAVLNLRILAGDATSPQAVGVKIIAHVCNDMGGWGKGFVVAVSRRWPGPEREYRAWYRGRADNDFGLGSVQLVQVEPDMHVANMVGQHGIRHGSDGPPVRYAAIEQCLDTLGDHARRLGASVHMPRIGCGLAGGRWDEVEPLIVKSLCRRDVAVTVYDFG